VSVSSPAATAPRTTLSRELNAFLVEFSVALHKHTMYPSGHPSLAPAAVRVTERAWKLLEDRPMLAFGVARHQLIIDGVATDPAQPVLRRLAEVLHQHRLGAVSLLPGIESSEIGSAIHLLAVEAGESVRPLGLEPAGRLNQWLHVRLHPLTLERLELVEEDPAAAVDAAEQLQHHAAQLWIGLASAAMAADASLGHETTATDPVAVARAIDDRAGAAAYDQVIVGYLLQIADELKGRADDQQGPLRRRTARLIDALQPETLKRLLAMGGDVAQRRAFVRGATNGMAIDSVVKIVKAAAEASQQTISHGLLRMLSKLATHAEAAEEHARSEADTELREQVDRLLSGWNLDDPNPNDYSKTLQRLASSAGPQSRGEYAGGSEHEADPLRLIQTGLEVGGSGPLVERAIDRAIDAALIRELRALTSTPPSCGSGIAALIQSKLGGPRTMAALLKRTPVDFDLLDILLPVISPDGYEVLLDALIESSSRGTRRRLIDRLARTTIEVTPLIAARLDDERWYVQRNLLLLLERLRTLPPDFALTQWLQHADARVRYQALSLQLKLPAEREDAVRAALEDHELSIIRLGLVAALEQCPPSLIPLLARLAANADLVEELRIHAVRALGKSRHQHALAALLGLVDGGKSIFGGPKLAAPGAVVLAALRALADVWSSQKEAQRFLALARRSFTKELRNAVRL
jgi:hypothetical protein